MSAVRGAKTYTKGAQRAAWKREGWDWARTAGLSGWGKWPIDSIVMAFDPQHAERDPEVNQYRRSGVRAFRAGKPRPEIPVVQQR